MSEPAIPSAEAELLARIEALLADPAVAANPLGAPMAELLAYCQSQQSQMRRLMKISDGYHLFSRDHTLTLEKAYDKQLRRLEKITRISDRYQQNLLELSDALRRASLSDPLTEIGNRRYLMERLTEEAQRAKRNGRAFVAGILDIDHFKRINDQYGHEIGDDALGAVARTIRSQVRNYDFCGRWGGEEFLVIFPETALDDARQIAERICTSIRNLQFEAIPQSITASMGLSLSCPGENYAETLRRADLALLQAKQNGRDRVETA